MARQFRVEHTDGSTETLPHVESKVEWTFSEQDLGTFVTHRAATETVSLTETEDEVFLVRDDGSEWGGLLKDVVRNGSQVELIVDGFERYARDAPPTDGDNIYENVDDSTVVSDAVSAVSELSAGTINTVDSGLSFVFSHSSQAKKARRVEKSTSGELKYNPDKTVDYVASLGSDKTTTTLSPSNQNVIDGMEVTRKGGDNKVTHLRVLGAGEGPAQVSAEVVASSYSAGDREIWDTYRDKGLTSQDSLQNLGETLIAELNSEHIEVEANIKNLSPVLGDEYHVTKSEENVDHDLRVVELTEIIDKDGQRFAAVLSNRQNSREDPESTRRQDIENYNVAFEGSPVTMTASGGRQPVTSSLDYEFDFYYPDEVEYEHRVKLFVKGLAYRAYAAGTAAGGDHTHTVNVTHPEHAHNVTHPAHAHTITSAEFAHSHGVSVDSVAAELHGHTDGTYGAASHPHSDGTLDADFHGHSDGSLDADSHPHSDGTLGAASHPHADGTLGADSHDHPQNITETSTANTPHGSVVADGSTISFPGDSNGWDELETIAESGYELGVIHVHATSAENPIEVRARDSSATSPGDTTGNNENFTPRVEGTALIGTSAADGDATGTVTLIVPEDWGFIDIDYRSTGDPNTNISITWMLIGEHTHDVTIGSPTGFDSPGVSGDTDSTAPDVGGDTGNTAPDVGGSTGSTSPGVGGDTGSTAPDVGGTSGDESPGVSGNTDSQGGIRTSETELGDTETSTTALGTTESESSDASGDHTHQPEPGVIESFGGTRHYPSNVDVLVNGTALGVSLGDGTGEFEQEVDLAGELNPGQVNTVRISSDSLGHIQAHLDIDVYRQILGNG